MRIQNVFKCQYYRGAINYFRIISALFIANLMSFSTVWAYEPDLPPGSGGGVNTTPAKAAIEYEKRQSPDERLRSFGPNLLGDGIDPNTGSLQFNITDVSLPGNFDLPVAISRKMSQGRYYHRNVSAEFGDWQIEAPRIQIVSTVSGPNLCSNNFFGNFPPVQVARYTTWYMSDYTNGLKMEIPGQGVKDLLAIQSLNTNLWPLGTKFVTVDGWRVSCNGQVIIGHSPDGSVYRFNQAIGQRADTLGSRRGGGPVLQRVRHMFAATLVTDVNGNTVNYDYDGYNRLTAIRASDGRRINLSYSGSSKLIRSVTSNPTSGPARTWNYSYARKTFPEIYNNGVVEQSLTRVTQPDGLFWTYNMAGMSVGPSRGDQCPQTSQNLSVKHPHGVTGSFLLGFTIHRMSYHLQETKSYACPGITGDVIPGGVPVWQLKTAKMMSVSRKTLSGPGMADQTWQYRYENDMGPPNTSSGDRTNQTIVTDPENIQTIYKHYWLAEPLGGKLASKETRLNGTTLEKQNYSYTQEVNYGATTIASGTTPRSTNSPTHTTKTVTLRDGDTYTSEVSYNTNQSSGSYSYGRQIQTKAYSNVSTSPRIISTTYEHNKTKWVLGLTKTVTRGDNIQMASNNYDSLGRKISQTRYGQNAGTFTYHSASSYKGAPYRITDPLGRRTELLEWNRGTPQRIRRAAGTADETNEYQYVDNNGWLTSSKNAMNRTTTYSRDAMGRLTRYNPTGSYWSNTDISYNFNGGGAVQTITKGQGRSTVTYDAMFRTILERSQALDTGWFSYTNTKYDRLGRVVFRSQPSTNQYETKGTDYTYDGLSRIKTERENVVPYAQTRHFYLSGHAHRVYKPANDGFTQYYSYGYDGPGNKDYRAIYKYPSAGSPLYTDIYKNQYGQIWRLRQWGNENGHNLDKSQSFKYDRHQRLCRHDVPEHGATKYQYNAAGEMTAYAKGQTNSGCGTVPNVNDKVNLAYDNLGRPTVTNFLDPATPDIHRTYDDNGNVTAVNRDGVNWSYQYNDLDLLTHENLDVDGQHYDSVYNYNSSGHRTQRETPSDRVINYNVDGLGRDLSITGTDHNYAQHIRYHVSGQLQHASFPNSADNRPRGFDHTFNDRQLIDKYSYFYGYTANYSYDANGRITNIDHWYDHNRDRSFTYDGLGRLKTAHSPMWGGAASFNYDSVGNLQGRTLGSRTITLNYDKNRNRLSQSVDSGATGIRAVGYDNRGNVTSLGNLSFVYDASDQPILVTGTANGVGVANGEYTYDGNLKRVISEVNGKKIYNVYDAAGQLIYIDDRGRGEKTDFVRIGTQLITKIKNDNPHWIYPDHLGSPVMEMGANGALVSKEYYTPFGLSTNPSNTTHQDSTGFTGHIKDSATGLNYMQARYYDPVIGRFLSIDPVTFLDTGSPSYFNRYRYCSNDPVNCTDPSGQSDWIPNFFSKMFKEESSQALGNFVESSMPAGSQMDTGNPDAAGQSMINPASEANAVGAMGGATMAAMDGMVEGYVQSQTMAIGGAGKGAVKVAGAATKAAPELYLYQKLSAAGQHLKYGTSKNPATRYTAKEMAGGRLKILAGGDRKSILALERNAHKTLPIGPEEGQTVYQGIQAAKGYKVPPY